jgi:hypothetical protein
VVAFGEPFEIRLSDERRISSAEVTSHLQAAVQALIDGINQRQSQKPVAAPSLANC